MSTFRVVSGIHIQADHEYEPSDEDKKRSEEDGVPLKAPSRTYQPGEVFESDTDMVAKHGPKFALVSEGGKKSRRGSFSQPPTKMKPTAGAGVFPAGQVSEGFQQTTSGTDGKPVSGLASDKVLEEIEEQGQEAADEKQKKTEAKAKERGQDVTNLRQDTERKPMKFGTKTTPVSRPGAELPRPTVPAKDDEEGEDSKSLDDMTVSELRDYAHEKRIELKGVIRKDEIVAAIKAAESEE